jgi:hypothetical protein
MGKNTIHEKEKVIKFIDWLIDDIENVEYFNIKDFINKYKDISEHEKGYLPLSIESVGKTYSLFENTLDSDGWFKLTEKGIKLKESGKSLSVYEQSQLTKWYNENWVGYSIAIITLIFAVYQWNENRELESDFLLLDLKLDSLNTQYDSLNAQHASFQTEFFELKKEIELKNSPKKVSK